MGICKIRLRYVFKLFLCLAYLTQAHQLTSCHLQALRIEACSAISTLARSRAFEVRMYARGLDREVMMPSFILNLNPEQNGKTHNCFLFNPLLPTAWREVVRGGPGTRDPATSPPPDCESARRRH